MTNSGDMAMEIYVHIPFCIKKCHYCDFLSAPADERLHNRYAGALLREIHFYGEKLGRVPVSTVYVGGGTPSCMAASYMELIIKQLRLSFDIAADAEITVECNPGTLTVGKLQSYRKLGVNRISIGLQSAHEDELQLLGRIHTYEQFLQSFDLARKCGFSNINVDLMSALPHQTADKFLASLKRVIALKPEHISVYTLMIEPGTPFYEQYKFDAVLRDAGKETHVLPSEDEEYEIYVKTGELLAQHGYEQYEISNYARKGYACRHNTGYWKRVPYLGLGLGAASLVDEVRYSNLTDIEDYIAASRQIRRQNIGETPAWNLHAAAQPLSRREQIEEYMFLGLRMREGVTREGFRNTFDVEIEAVYGEVLRLLAEQQLIIRRAGNICLSDQGMNVSNYVLAQFLLGE